MPAPQARASMRASNHQAKAHAALEFPLLLQAQATHLRVGGTWNLAYREALPCPAIGLRASHRKGRVHGVRT